MCRPSESFSPNTASTLTATNTHATLISVTRAQSRPLRMWVPRNRNSTVSINAPTSTVAPLILNAIWITALSRDNTTTPRNSAKDARTGVGGRGPTSIITARHRIGSSSAILGRHAGDHRVTASVGVGRLVGEVAVHLGLVTAHDGGQRAAQHRGAEQQPAEPG